MLNQLEQQQETERSAVPEVRTEQGIAPIEAMRELAHQQKRGRDLLLRAYAVCGAVIGLAYFFSRFNATAAEWMNDAFVAVLLTFVVLSIVAFLARWRWRQVAQRLVREDDPRLIGALVGSLNDDDEHLTGMVQAAAINLLPRLQTTDSQYLDERERAILNHALWKNQRHPKLALAILKALERVGDGSALPVVRELARSAQLAPVQAAAQECLPYLEHRSEGYRQRSTLLRPSESAPEEALLRPAGHPIVDQRLLLPAELNLPQPPPS